MKVSKDKIINILKDNTDFCIYTHIKPDGDAIGSAFGLAMALQKLGKKVSVKCQDPWPCKFNELINDFVDDSVDKEIGIAVDVSSASRLGVYEKANISVCIDHHASNLCIIENTYLEEDTISCSSIVFRLLEGLMPIVSPKVRELLFIGLLTDSDGFKSSEVTMKVFADAKDMLSVDVNPSVIIKKYYASKTIVELECEKTILESVSFHFENKVTIAVLPHNLHCKIGYGNTDSLASLTARIVGVELGVTIFEKAECEYSISIRSTGKWDASLLALSLGGGGHRSASGANVSGVSLTELITKIEEHIRRIYMC